MGAAETTRIVENWDHPDIFAGLPGRSAEDVWYGNALILEHATATGQAYTAGVADLNKYSDRIPRTLLHALLFKAGIPLRVLQAYASYHRHSQYQFTLGDTLGEAHERLRCIPQGCPLSMLFMALFFSTVGALYA